jgi:low temperature requirement protein LtrA
VLAASDAYSYLHLVIVAGIIIFAVGAKLLIEDVSKPLSEAGRLALCGGVALYLLGHVAFRLRMVGVLGYQKLAVVGALLALFALGGALPAWSVAGTITVLLAGLCVLETRESYSDVDLIAARE